MRCPHCGLLEDRVLESRQNSVGSSIRRRRECLECGYRFTSYERIEEKPVMVIKRDGRLEPYEPMKMERGILTAMEKRPIGQKVRGELLQAIEDEVAYGARNSHEITSKELGEIVLRRLYKVDKVAYVRFASVYRMFDNVDEFIREIAHLTETGGNGDKSSE
jgi:transcriptional repressor NrdR